MNKAFEIFRIRGVPVKIHWSFLLMILALVVLAIAKKFNSLQLINFFVFLTILFICVLLHELGHAIAATKLKVKAKDILLSPIGGLARLESLEDYPKKEMIIALSGPLSNLSLAVISYLFIKVFSTDIILSFDVLRLDKISLGSILNYVLLINLFLCFLNLVPAFPMDGGRVLRALLSLIFDKRKASYISISISRVLALVCMIYGAISKMYVLLLISLIVWLMASKEMFGLRMSEKDIKKAGPSFPPTNRPEEDLNT